MREKILKKNSSQSIFSSRSLAGTSRTYIDLSLSLPKIEHENVLKDTTPSTTEKDARYQTCCNKERWTTCCISWLTLYNGCNASNAHKDEVDNDDTIKVKAILMSREEMSALPCSNKEYSDSSSSAGGSDNTSC